ncbi:MAG: hypothetical protein ACREL5_04375, partial [Gemmatimonadales bacterium]
MSDPSSHPESANDGTDDLMARLQQAVAGRYQLDCPIGRGAMGVVFRARDVGEARTVALKVMRPAIGFEDGIV